MGFTLAPSDLGTKKKELSKADFLEKLDIIPASKREYSSIVALWLMMDLPFLCNHAAIATLWMFSGRFRKKDSLKPVISSNMAV